MMFHKPTQYAKRQEKFVFFLTESSILHKFCIECTYSNILKIFNLDGAVWYTKYYFTDTISKNVFIFLVESCSLQKLHIDDTSCHVNYKVKKVSKACALNKLPIYAEFWWQTPYEDLSKYIENLKCRCCY